MKTIISQLKKGAMFSILFGILHTGYLSSQTLINTIDIPTGDGQGAMVGDLLHANGYIFAYTLDKLIIYDASNNNTFEKEILFKDYRVPQNEDPIPRHGKFNPIFYNLTVPYINEYTNNIYLPNGGHSSISNISFEVDETLQLQEGEWSWLSFPRMERADNESVAVTEVFDNGNIDPGNYEPNSKLQNFPIVYNDPEMLTNLYTYLGWEVSGDLPNVQSTLGYKLYLKYDPPEEVKWLHMQGTLFDPSCIDCKVDLLGFNSLGLNHENWVGYYLPYPQDPVEAIPDEFINDIEVIKGQYWTCYKDYCEGQADTCWICAVASGHSSASLNYGDMVILITDGDDINDFTWKVTGGSDGTLDERAATEYYEYTETADYTPIFIELDSTSSPLEIGAFVEDSCIGATTVNETDTLVLISAYTEGLNGVITFEEYYGGLKSTSQSMKDYFVKNRQTRRKERRNIHTREKQPYYVVSFKNSGEQDEEIAYFRNELQITCSPNPMKSNTSIDYTIPEDGYVKLYICDIYGKRIKLLKEGFASQGTHSMEYYRTDAVGSLIKNGIYFVTLEYRDVRVNAKVVVMR